jgi:cytochrome c biogenesis factor
MYDHMPDIHRLTNGAWSYDPTVPTDDGEVAVRYMGTSFVLIVRAGLLLLATDDALDAIDRYLLRRLSTGHGS